MKRDLRSRNRRTILGVFWVILGPVLATSVIVLSLSGIFAGNFGSISEYALYTLSGVIFIQFTSFALIGTSNCVLGARGLITKIAVPALLFPYAAIISALITWTISTSYLLVLNVWLVGRWPSPVILVAFLGYAGFLFGIGLMISAINARYEDVGSVMPLAIQALMFVTPIFYSVDIWPPAVRNLLELNPVYWYLLLYRSAVGVGESVSTTLMVGALAIALVVAAMGIAIHLRRWPATVRAL